VIAFSALIAMAGVLLIFQLGQPRIWMSMSRDGLLPKAFSRIHPRYKTPSFATIVTGFVVAIPALFMNLAEVTDLTSIGTLFAFVVVCSGILILDNRKDKPAARFKVPFVSSRYVMPVLLAVALFLNIRYNAGYWQEFFTFPARGDNLLTDWLSKLPMMVFLLTACLISLMGFYKKLSLIPAMGLLSCLFLMTKLGHSNWLRFSIWLLIGIVVYFTFSIRNSRLNRA
jgi:amino acid transporter